MFKAIGKMDGIISAAGEARFAPLEKLSDEDFSFSIANKLIGQVNLTRIGMDLAAAMATPGPLGHSLVAGKKSLRSGRSGQFQIDAADQNTQT